MTDYYDNLHERERAWQRPTEPKPRPHTPAEWIPEPTRPTDDERARGKAEIARIRARMHGDCSDVSPGSNPMGATP